MLCTFYRLWRCTRDCKTTQMKVIKCYRKPYGSCQIKLSAQLRICVTVNKGWVRGSRPEVLCKKVVLRNFAKIHFPCNLFGGESCNLFTWSGQREVCSAIIFFYLLGDNLFGWSRQREFCLSPSPSFLVCNPGKTENMHKSCKVKISQKCSCLYF